MKMGRGGGGDQNLTTVDLNEWRVCVCVGGGGGGSAKFGLNFRLKNQFSKLKVKTSAF